MLRIVKSFDDQPSRPDAADPVDVFPGQRGVELRCRLRGDRFQVVAILDVTCDVTEIPSLSAQCSEQPRRFAGKIDQVIHIVNLGRHRQAVLDVLVTLTDDLEIDSQDQCAAFRGEGTLDQGFGKSAILHHVQLKPEWLFGVLRICRWRKSSMQVMSFIEWSLAGKLNAASDSHINSIVETNSFAR